MGGVLAIIFLFGNLLLLPESSFSLPLCTDSRAPFTLNTTLSFCPYDGKTCCNSTEDLQLQNQLKDMNISNSGCASLLKSILCAKCDQFSAELFTLKSIPRPVPLLCNSTASDSSQSREAITDFCTEVWDTCQNVSILNSPFSPSLQGQAGAKVNSSFTKLTDFWQSKADFCNAFGGKPTNESVCFDGEPVTLNDTGTPRPPKGLCLEKIGNGSYLSMVAHPDGSNRAFFSNQAGKIWLATIPEQGSGGTMGLDESNPFVDLTDEVHFDTVFGMMGMAFHPNFAKNGRFFASFNCDKVKWPGCAGRCSCNSDVNCDPSKLGGENGAQPCQYQTVIAEYTANGTASEPSLAKSAQPSEVRRIFTMGLPFTGQHGGQILFGPNDGYLYFMMGYGGGTGDPYNFSQNKKSLLGKIMRLDVDNIPSTSEIAKFGFWGNYSIPKDNPFSEDGELQPEIWALGLRNPWRSSFDSERPSYFMCGDTGQDLYEEVNIITRGGNYGWRLYEGPYPYTPPATPGGTTPLNSVIPMPPVLGYNHSELNKIEGSASIIGGYFYRSTTDPCMYGRYLYADLYASALWAANENPENSGNFTTNRIPFSCAHDSPTRCNSLQGGDLPSLGFIFSFGEDNRKDIFILASQGVYRVVRPSRCNYTCSKETVTPASPTPSTTPSPSSSNHLSHAYNNLAVLFSSLLFLLISFIQFKKHISRNGKSNQIHKSSVVHSKTLSTGAPFTLNTTLSFCPYDGKTCCNSTEDLQLQNQLKDMNISNSGCASLLKSILCAKCDQFSAELFTLKSIPRPVPLLCNSTASDSSQSREAITDFCTEVWDTCQNVSILNSPFSPSLQGQAGAKVNSNFTKLTDFWQSKADFCNAFGGKPTNESVCFDGEPVTLNDTGIPSPPKGLCLEKIGNGSYLSMVAHPDGSNRAFFSNQAGKIWLATIPEQGSGGTMGLDESNPFVDLTDEVHLDTVFGMMGMAFHPNFAKNGRFFASFNCDKVKWPGCAGRCSCNSDVDCDPSKLGVDNGAQPCQYQTVIAEYTANGTASEPSLAKSAQPSEVRRIFTMGLPFTSNHGGQILFGPNDGYLYFLMGDGGGTGDPYNFSQNKKSLLGKIMRLDVDTMPSTSEIEQRGFWGNYSIPKDNPFSEDRELQPEIWALGLRNPWRSSFDSERPSYFMCADTGENLYEEVDVITKGGNYGWRLYEGPYPYTPPATPRGTTPLNSVIAIPPVLGYNHSEVNKIEGSASITGGYFYRSTTDPCMYGRYLYADLYATALWAANENPENSGNFTTNRIPFSCAHDSPTPCNSLQGSDLPSLGYILSFGEDNRKDIFILASQGVYRVVRPTRCNYTCSKETVTPASPTPSTTPSPSSSNHLSHTYNNLAVLFSSLLFLLIDRRKEYCSVISGFLCSFGEMGGVLAIIFLFSNLLLLPESSFSLPLCTDSRAPFTLNTTLSFCPYDGKTCCNSTEDLQLQNQLKDMNISNSGCASLLKSILCAKCDQFSAELFTLKSVPRPVPLLCNSTASDSSQSREAITDFCTEVWDTCQNVSILNSPFSPSLQGQAGAKVNSNFTKLTDFWQSKADFCNAFGGKPTNESVCFDGEPVTLNDTGTPNPPKGLCLEKIANGSYLNMVAHPDGSNRAFFSNQAGKIWLATIPEQGSGGTMGLDESNPFVDLTDEVHLDTVFGMMGMAFHPNFAKNGRFFASFNCDKVKWPGCAGRCSCNSDVNCDPSKLGGENGAQPCQYQTVIAEYTANGTASEPSLAKSAKPSEVRRIFTMGLPFTGQHGGQILFGPNDGYLYFMMGDGGGTGDPYNFSQNKKSLLGKIMRLDVDNIPSTSEIEKLGFWGNYSIPKDNPFSEDGKLQPEIWALGLRNPWRSSFDSERPSYFMCADVGQDLYEEVNIITRGGNYGWRLYEGPYPYTPPATPGGTTPLNSVIPIPPVLGYNHSEVNKIEGSASIIGGYFYRSTTDPCMYGRYLYADLYANALWAANENPENSGNFTTNRIPFSCAHDSPTPCNSLQGSNLPSVGYIFSFGEDNRKDIFILASQGVYRVVRPSRCNYTCSKETVMPASPTPSTTPSFANHLSRTYNNLAVIFSSLLFLLVSLL
ncbi:hypothetical protein QYF36_022170 [Acer negundo]|nr:hypothetical protein QYF36_022170 [Acer negundo]